MKNSIKTFAVALAFIAASFTANAEENETKKSAGFGTGIYTTKSGKIKVFVDKASADASTTLLLRNVNGQIVYRETFGRNELKFARTLDVAALSAGKYEIEITSNGEKQSKSLEVSEQKTERVLAIL